MFFVFAPVGIYLLQHSEKGLFFFSVVIILPWCWNNCCSVAPPLGSPGHGERQRDGGEGGDLPVERARQEELVEGHHGDGLAEDHADGHDLRTRTAK